MNVPKPSTIRTLQEETKFSVPSLENAFSAFVVSAALNEPDQQFYDISDLVLSDWVRTNQKELEKLGYVIWPDSDNKMVVCWHEQPAPRAKPIYAREELERVLERP